MMRAQTSLPALGLAFLVLTAVTVLGVVVADGAALSADRSSLDEHAAVALSDRLVSASAPVTVRANVLNATAIAGLNDTALRTRYGLATDADAKITLEGKTVVRTGSVENHPDIERLVVVRERHSRTITPAFVAGNEVTLPRRTAKVRLNVRPPANTTVRTVRADDRIILHNDSGLRGTYTASLSRRRTVRLSFDATDRLSTGDVTITYYPVETRKARLGVTVDG